MPKVSEQPGVWLAHLLSEHVSGNTTRREYRLTPVLHPRPATGTASHQVRCGACGGEVTWVVQNAADTRAQRRRLALRGWGAFVGATGLPLLLALSNSPIVILGVIVTVAGWVYAARAYWTWLVTHGVWVEGYQNWKHHSVKVPPRSARRQVDKAIARSPAAGPAATTITATLRTSAGVIVLRLFPDQAPNTVQNFVGLAEGTKEWTDPRTGKPTKARIYDGTTFHRVRHDMIQGGDPVGNGTGTPGYLFDAEIHPDLKFDRPGLLGMAHGNDINANGCQFFITTSPAQWLTGRYTIFGEVIEGQDVVQRISAGPSGKSVEIGASPPVVHDLGIPRQAVVIESVTIGRSG